MDFQSAFRDDQIAMRPVSDFEGIIPPAAKQSIDDAPDKPHAIMLERLKLELEERTSLTAVLEQKRAHKKQLQVWPVACTSPVQQPDPCCLAHRYVNKEGNRAVLKYLDASSMLNMAWFIYPVYL